MQKFDFFCFCFTPVCHKSHEQTTQLFIWLVWLCMEIQLKWQTVQIFDMGAAAQRNHTQKSNECPMDNHYKKAKRLPKWKQKMLKTNSLREKETYMHIHCEANPENIRARHSWIMKRNWMNSIWLECHGFYGTKSENYHGLFLSSLSIFLRHLSWQIN